MSTASRRGPGSGARELQRTRKSAPKAKTGCITCRIRRVKCDEGKPQCNCCLSTGRTCDGYESLFRICNIGPSSLSAGPGLPLSLYQPKVTIVAADQVNKLSYHFTIKRFGRNVSYDTEARATLAGLSDPAVRHALLSLSALSESFEAHGEISTITDGTTLASVHRGLEEYNTAVTSLASRLTAEASPTCVRSVLLCCRLFISIEVTLGNYNSAIQHYIRGLRVMYQYRSRPAVDDSGHVLSCSSADLPCLDAFVIKLFASAWSLESEMERRGPFQAGPAQAESPHVLLQNQARGELGELSVQVTGFLTQLTMLQHQHQVSELLRWKTQLLGLLQNWEDAYSEPVRQIMGGSFPIVRRFGAGFSALLHQVLKLTLCLAMESSSAREAGDLAPVVQELGDIADFLTKTKNLCVRQPWNQA